MDLGYDAYLDRELEDHARRGYEADYIHEQVVERATEMVDNPVEFLEWLSEWEWQLSDISLISTTGKKVNARALLLAHADAWVLEQILAHEEVDDAMLAEIEIPLADGNFCRADEFLISQAPAWLKNRLTEWLADQNSFQREVKASIEEAKRLDEEDEAASIAESRWEGWQ